MEKELDLFDINIDGVPIWERIRLSVHRELMYELDEWSDEEPGPSPGVGLYLQKIELWARNLVVRNPFLSDEHDVLYWGHHRRKRQSDGYWWDLYTDPIHVELDQDYLQVELPHYTEHHTPAKTASLRYLDLITVSAGIARRLGLVDVSMSSADRHRLRTIEERIAEVFSADVDVTERVRQHLVDRRALKPLYHRLLSRVDPSFVVLVVHSGKETFIETCKEFGVPVIELQQAILNKYEYAYSFPGDRTKQTFPDYYFSWGEFWNDQVEFPIPDDHVMTVGYPYLERMRRQYEEVEQTEQLLFVSQPNIGDPLASAAVTLASASELDMNVVYKLHPHEYADWKALYPQLVDADLDVVAGDDRPLYELFAESSAQVGVFSTAIYEGLSFEIDTYLMDLPGVEHLATLYEDGPATLVGSSEELITALASPESESVDPTYFFEPDAVANIQRAFETVRKRSR